MSKYIHRPAEGRLSLERALTSKAMQAKGQVRRFPSHYEKQAQAIKASFAGAVGGAAPAFLPGTGFVWTFRNADTTSAIAIIQATTATFCDNGQAIDGYSSPTGRSSYVTTNIETNGDGQLYNPVTFGGLSFALSSNKLTRAQQMGIIDTTYLRLHANGAPVGRKIYLSELTTPLQVQQDVAVDGASAAVEHWSMPKLGNGDLDDIYRFQDPIFWDKLQNNDIALVFTAANVTLMNQAQTANHYTTLKLFLHEAGELLPSAQA